MDEKNIAKEIRHDLEVVKKRLGVIMRRDEIIETILNVMSGRLGHWHLNDSDPGNKAPLQHVNDLFKRDEKVLRRMIMDIIYDYDRKKIKE